MSFIVSAANVVSGGILGLVLRYIEGFSVVLSVFDDDLRISFGRPQASKPAVGVEPLEKLDEARSSIMAALTALESVKQDAEASKTELSNARLALAEILASKKDAQTKLDAIEKLAELKASDVRRTLGITHPLVAFASGVFASIVAAGLIWLFPMAVQAVRG